MGAGGSIPIFGSTADVTKAALEIRPDWAGKSDEELMLLIKKDLLYAKEAREVMPHGYVLEKSVRKEGDDAASSSSSLEGLASKVGHICRVVKDADVSVKFYQNVVGAKLLNRPQFATNGFWLWLGNTQLHLIQSDLVIRPDHPDGGTRVNHISFDVYDFDECEKRIKAAAIKYEKVYVPCGDNRGIRQIFFQDPDYHWIELCDCYKMNDFIYGEYNEERAKEMAKFYHEGVDMKGAFMASVLFELMGRGQGMKDIFNVYANGNRKITGQDMLHVLRKMEAHTDETSSQNLLDAIDADHNGYVTYDEFVKYVSKTLSETQSGELVESMFHAIDKDATGTITRKEFIEFVSVLGIQASAMEAWEAADSSKNGNIDVKEFGELFTAAQAKILSLVGVEKDEVEAKNAAK